MDSNDDGIDIEVSFGDNEDTGDFEINEEEDVYEDENDVEEDSIKMNTHNPKWTDYVLSHLQEDELINGCPTTDGLRRVTERVFGKIINSSTQVVQAPCEENSHHAVVIVSLGIRCFYDDELIYVDGATDVVWRNTPDPKFHLHSVATAETRAEGRALRRALRLNKILVAEENQKVKAKDWEAENEKPRTEGYITENQEGFISRFAKMNNIDVKKVILDLFPTLPNVRAMTDGQFKELQNRMNEIVQSEKVSEVFLGYKDSWRVDF